MCACVFCAKQQDPNLLTEGVSSAVTGKTVLSCVLNHSNQFSQDSSPLSFSSPTVLRSPVDSPEIAVAQRRFLCMQSGEESSVWGLEGTDQIFSKCFSSARSLKRSVLLEIKGLQKAQLYGSAPSSPIESEPTSIHPSSTLTSVSRSLMNRVHRPFLGLSHTACVSSTTKTNNDTQPSASRPVFASLWPSVSSVNCDP